MNNPKKALGNYLQLMYFNTNKIIHQRFFQFAYLSLAPVHGHNALIRQHIRTVGCRMEHRPTEQHLKNPL